MSFGSIVSLAVAGCHAAKHERATVAVSIFPLYDLVRRVAGPDADVTLVLPAGTAPEGWSPPVDAAAKAALLVSVGLGLDPWMDPLLSRAAPKAKTLKLGDRVPTISSADGAIDGYVWMDPERARLMATAIAEELARADSPHAIAYGERASTLDRSLAALDKETEARTTAWSTRDVAVPPSLAYYAERYGLPERPKPAAGRRANVDAARSVRWRCSPLARRARARELPPPPPTKT